MIAVVCSGCRQETVVEDILAGRQVPCPGCGRDIPIPGNHDTTLVRPGPGATLATDEGQMPRAAQQNETAAFASGEMVPPVPSGSWVMGGHPQGYQILEELGRGGMGIVYKARQVGLNRIVALKIIRAGHLAGTEERTRFRTEGEAIARLQHGGIVQVYEIGEHGGMPFFSLEFCPGGSLASRLGGKPLPPKEAARLVQQLAWSIHAAHQSNVIHRDLKPANVLISADGTPKITDFGLAKKLDEQGQTQTGAVMGTPAYMAPEQAAGNKNLGPAVDVYSLGAILYECLTGRPPFLSASPLDVVLQVLSQEAVPPSQFNGGVPADIETITLKALEKAPAQRYASAAALADDLGRFLQGEPIQARPVGTPERLLRWCKKRPAVAGLLAAVFSLLTLLALTGSAAYLRATEALAREETLRLEAERLRTVAEEERGAALTQREAAVAAERHAGEEAERNRRLLYAADMRLAAEMWQGEHDSAGRIDRLISPWAVNGREDLREFAWRYQWGLIHDAANILRDGRPKLARGAWRSDGTLVTIDGQGVLRKWDAAAGKLLGRSELGGGDGNFKLDLSADGAVAAVLSGAKVVRIYDTRSGRQTTLEIPGKGAAVGLSPDGAHVVVSNPSGVVKWVWATATGELLRTSRLKTEPAQAMAVLPGGLVVAERSGLLFTYASLLDLKKSKRSGPLPAVTTLHSMACSRDGKQIAGGTMRGEVVVWQTDPFREKARYSVHVLPVRALSFSPDGKRVASADPTGMFALTDLESGKVLFRGKGHTAPANFLSFSPDGDKLVTGGLDGTTRIWDLRRAPGPRILSIRQGSVRHLAGSPDGRWLAATQSRAVLLWDAHSWNFVKALEMPLEPRSLPTRVAFAPDSNRLAVGDVAGVVRLYDVSGGKLLRTLKADAAPVAIPLNLGVAALAFSPDGRWLAAGHGSIFSHGGNYDQVLRVWDLRSGKALPAFPHDNTVSSVAFSADGSLLASGCEDGLLRTWKMPDWQPGPVRKAPRGIGSVAVSPQGGLIAAGQATGAIHVWETGSEKAPRILDEHLNRVIELAFTPDGKTLASASHDHTLRLWHVASGRAMNILRDHRQLISALAIVPDGNTIASGDSNGVIRLWQAPSFARIDAIKSAAKR